MPTAAISTEMYAAPRLRSRMIASGSNGCSARSCRTMKAPISTTAAASMPQVSGEPQPCDSALEKP